jgi:hypothetical protein
MFLATDEDFQRRDSSNSQGETNSAKRQVRVPARHLKATGVDWRREK